MEPAFCVSEQPVGRRQFGTLVNKSRGAGAIGRVWKSQSPIL